VQSINYDYASLSRLLTANYNGGADYTYGYDVAGNLINNNGVTRMYNAANQTVDDGTNTL
jgi:YD repeat-containing protein